MKTLFILAVIYLAKTVSAMGDEGKAPPSGEGERKLVRNPSTGELFYHGQPEIYQTCGKFF